MHLRNTEPRAAREVSARAKEVFFIGIGGVSMSSLAVLTAARGVRVSGSDRAESEHTVRLRQAGIRVTIGHDAKNLGAAEAVVYSLAVPAENPEYAAALARGIPVISRAAYLGALMLDYPVRVGVAGSHGKSTVTAMLGEIFAAVGRDPTVVCGATMKGNGAPLLVGKGGDFLFEACEYGDSFLAFTPTVAVLLGISLDHVDYFHSLAEIRRSFTAFAARAGENGVVVYAADDPNARAAALASGVRSVGFGLTPMADVCAEGITAEEGYAAFTVRGTDGCRVPVRLRVAGRHHVTNALAAFAAAGVCGIPSEVSAAALCSFGGIARRMEYKGTFCGARVYDDYAHHPEEIAAVLRAARLLLGGGGRLFAVFQSHTYSRTAAFFGEICGALRAADRVFLADIYPARETETLGMSAARLAAGVGESAAYVGDLSAIASALAAELSPGDLLLVMGAGDVDRIFTEFSRKAFTS